jgi:putative pyruvate formate lyase activating enzyme
MDPDLSAQYMNARDYPERMRAALIEMQRQVGVLQTENGVAARGLLVRHLVMPGCAEDSKRILRFIAEEVSPDTWVNVMPQYRPLYKAVEHPEIARPPTTEEFAEVRLYAQQLGMNLF